MTILLSPRLGYPDFVVYQEGLGRSCGVGEILADLKLLEDLVGLQVDSEEALD